MALNRHVNIDKVMDKKTVEELLTRVAPFSYPKIMEEFVKCDYFKAPASKLHHLNVEGGLCKHSINVCDVMAMMAMTMGIKVNNSDVILAGLFHDIEKAYVFSSLKKNGLSHSELAVKVCANLGFSEEIQRAVRWHEGLYTQSLSRLSQKEMIEVINSVNKGPLPVLLHLADMLTSQITEREEGSK